MARREGEPIFYGNYPGGDSFAQTLRDALPSLNGKTPEDPIFAKVVVKGQGAINRRDSVNGNATTQPEL